MIWLAIAGLVALVFAQLYVKRRVRDLHRVREHRNDFYAAAGKLIDADDTPDILVRELCFLAQQIADRRTPWILMLALITGRVRKVGSPGSERQNSALRPEMVPERLQPLLIQALVSWVLAVTHNSTLTNWTARTLFLSRIRKKGKRDFRGVKDAQAVAWAFETRQLKNGAAA